ncbi:hypothetical protein M2323_003549 [Rhodoblastus acidophilus]|uniref:DUF4034 domain-containing protein n=1 Tax=Rhodoblastus acidophilus TaxID=1074 RepID=UPI0022244274|nr:DUF4034 domain-containing protein [Rhodoblastus acidophilus]MCW2285634.1 hypothetical protein [Rhodoblastus acidophilus]MCW2334608.1 hypothetical protein [Rhodoblastus acidophilus]
MSLSASAGAAEDATRSPLTPAQVAAQNDGYAYARYLANLNMRYHLSPPDGSFTGDLAPTIPADTGVGDLDAEGRPKWFDGGNSWLQLAALPDQLFEREQFDDLDRLFDDWNQPNQRSANGGLKLLTYHTSLSRRFSAAYWEKDGRILRHWRDAKPKSAAAAVTEAIYWRVYAWNARGGGYANTVSPEGWRLFRDRMAKAEAVLRESKAYAANNPVWHREYIGVLTESGAPMQQAMDALKQAVETKQDCSQDYTQVADHLSPKWGGSWKLVEAFATEATENPRNTYGAMLYTWIYLRILATNSGNVDFFGETEASWPKMKRGFEEARARYPHSVWSLNEFAGMACVAGDGATYRTLVTQIGGNILRGAWPPNHSPDLCAQKFAPASHPLELPR